ncbi:MAG: DNA polymerase III subunit gamma/tau [Bacteroidetes bacterium]|nr:DNA polymerase III subunit gamma/tau [Bacteroidota bacterium]MBL6943071.1 DNA polymerase III subunit gamma/tau [Bacteroidales bacterium]
MDNFIVSARKYRPATFHQVVGQDSITATLQNAIKNNHLAQAFLFTGPRGVGKTTCARILAKTINCDKLTDELEPCDKCESCTSFNNNASFNIHELDAASNNSVDDIRNLVEQVRIPPQIGNYKVYIIDEVHMLSQAAFNAFLKTLEEPPAYAKFILATTEKHKIIPTILSRCQIFDFKRINVEDITNYLGYVAEKENIETEIEARHIIAQKADGALRDALSTFDQIVSYSGNKVSYKDVIENLNILDYEYYFTVTDSLLNNDIPNLLLIFNEIIENGFDGQHFIVGLLEHLRSLLVLKSPATIGLMHASGSLKEKYSHQAGNCSSDFLLNALQTCNKFDLSYKGSSNKRLHIEIALLELSSITATPSSAVPNLESKKNAVKPIIEEKKPEYKLSPAQVEKPIGKKDDSEKKLPSEQTSKKEDNAAKKITPVDSGNGRKIKNISIKQSLEVLRKKNDDINEVPESIIATEFSLEKLTEIWELFIVSYIAKSPSFANAIAKYKPVLKDGFEIEYKVDSMIIAKDTLSVTSLLEFLKKELNNNLITLKPITPEKNEQKVAYTDSEKFAEMTKKYPEILKLKDKLNLEIEF